MKSEGGYIWACKNYDGDVMSDLVAAAAGSLPMMTSVLVSPDGCFEYEAAHGTVTDHFYRYRRGEKVSTNPLATIAAWSGALKKRSELDGNAALMQFAELLGRAGIDVFEQGYLSEDLAALCDPEELVEMPDNPRTAAHNTRRSHWPRRATPAHLLVESRFPSIQPLSRQTFSLGERSPCH